MFKVFLTDIMRLYLSLNVCIYICLDISIYIYYLDMVIYQFPLILGSQMYLCHLQRGCATCFDFRSVPPGQILASEETNVISFSRP
jgi:hypothetical protein